MIKELSYLREYVRLELELDCHFNDSIRRIVMKKMDTAIGNIMKGKLQKI